MKHHLFAALFFAGSLLPVAAAPHAEEPVLFRQAQALACLAGDMDATFHASLDHAQRYRSLSRAELSCRESLCHLAGIAGQFRRSVELRISVEDMERGLAAMQEAFRCAAENTRGVAVPTQVRGMLQQFSQNMACVEHLSFEAYVRIAPEHGHQHHHPHRTEAGLTDARGIYFRVPVQTTVPFVFRQPLR